MPTSGFALHLKGTKEMRLHPWESAQDAGIWLLPGLWAVAMPGRARVPLPPLLCTGEQKLRWGLIAAHSWRLLVQRPS